MRQFLETRNFREARGSSRIHTMLNEARFYIYFIVPVAGVQIRRTPIGGNLLQN